MKKAVVLEIKEEYAAVLTDEGLVQKIRNENYTVGLIYGLSVSTNKDVYYIGFEDLAKDQYALNLLKDKDVKKKAKKEYI